MFSLGEIEGLSLFRIEWQQIELSPMRWGLICGEMLMVFNVLSLILGRLILILIKLGKEMETGEGWTEGKWCSQAHAHTHSKGRPGGFRFIAFPFQSCLFFLALLWLHGNHIWPLFFYSFGGVGTKRVVSCWFGSENLNTPGRAFGQL